MRALRFLWGCTEVILSATVTWRVTMRGFGRGDSGDPEGEDLDDEGAGDVVLVTGTEVACPHCGEALVIGLVPGGGKAQEYVEDCQVCCRPCPVRVRYDDSGRMEVLVEEMP